VGDDIELYTDDTRSEVLFTWHGLRQQTKKPVIGGVPNPNQCLADFIAPKLIDGKSGIADYIGLFAVTSRPRHREARRAVRGEARRLRRIMLKAIADRLAEAFAEMLHERVRKDLWGYAADEALAARR
jgi:5-methyltetrahydrofolate--homocysteine methyltransferase